MGGNVYNILFILLLREKDLNSACFVFIIQMVKEVDLRKIKEIWEISYGQAVGVNLLLYTIKLREHPKAILNQADEVTQFAAQVITRGMVKSR